MDVLTSRKPTFNDCRTKISAQISKKTKKNSIILLWLFCICEVNPNQFCWILISPFLKTQIYHFHRYLQMSQSSQVKKFPMMVATFPTIHFIILLLGSTIGKSDISQPSWILYLHWNEQFSQIHQAFLGLITFHMFPAFHNGLIMHLPKGNSNILIYVKFTRVAF